MNEKTAYENEGMEKNLSAENVSDGAIASTSHGNQVTLNTGQEEFVNQLIDKSDQATGIRLIVNRFSVLLLKCIYTRKQKKFMTIMEVLLPIIVFVYALNNANQVNPIDKLADEKTSTLSKGFNNSQFLLKAINPRSKIYYSIDSDSEDELGKFLRTNFPEDTFEKVNEKIPDSEYMLANFTKFTKDSIRYGITISSKNDFYEGWGDDVMYFYMPNRKPVDQFHEQILKAYSERFNPDAKKYELKFNRFLNVTGDSEEPEKPDDERELKYKNVYVFMNYTISFFAAFFITCAFVLGSVCDEKKKRNFEFLKLMGATHVEIFFGHFTNHFLFALPALIIILITFINYVPADLLPTNVTLLIILISFLFLIHLICFLFLLSAPFEKYIYPELIFVISTFGCVSLTTTATLKNDLLIFLTTAHPYMMLQKFKAICSTELIYEFDFKESFIDIFTHSSSKQMSIFTLQIIVIFWIIVELMLTNYILQVNPFQKGIAKPFLYFLMPSYWKPATSITTYEQPNLKEFEKIPSNRKPSIILKNVYKSFISWFTFGKIKVLQDFNFAIFEKQITVLLGHNGAGKTTTMDLIAGLSSSDSGSISVNGIPVNPFTTKFKNTLGYCPQENIFYDTLTVYQNLKIAALLKGVSNQSLNSKILSLAKQFDLQNKLSEFANNLSGGMKRRLCLAIAIIGYNDVMMIDEPTSGLDPENRRKVWEILLELRKYKTILLTTHFLEEADILGDTIAIMHSGKVRCCGSTMFLKKIYHVGYLLRLALTKNVEEDELMEMVKKYIPNAAYESRKENEHFIRLTQSEEDVKTNLNLMIADLFDAFETNEISSSFGIQTYGLTNTSLEDVFIKIGSLDQPKEETIELETAQDHPLHNLNRVSGLPLYVQQFSAIFIKKLKLTIKNLQLFVSSVYPIVLPALSVFIVTIILSNFDRDTNKHFSSFDLKRNFGSESEILLVKDSLSAEGSNLFKSENNKWWNEKFGIKTIVQSDLTNPFDAINQERNKLGFNVYKDRLVFASHRINDYVYDFYISSFKFPFSLVGVLESFYRTVAKMGPEGKDFDVNLSFDLTKPEQEDKNDIGVLFQEVIFKTVMKIAVNSILVISLAIMFSFPFVAFVEVLHDEMNSGALEMQIIAGLSKTLYWIGNLIFDYCYYLIVLVIGCAGLYAWDNKNIFTHDMGEIYLAFALSSFNCLLVTYLIVNLRLPRQITDIVIKYSIFITALIIGIYDYIFFVLVITAQLQTHDVKKILDSKKFNAGGSWLLKIISPVYNSMDTMFESIDRYMVRNCLIKTENELCKALSKRDYDFKYNILYYFISMTFFGFLIFLANYYAHKINKAIERLKVTWRIFRSSSKEIEQVLQKDVKRELNLNFLSNIEDPNIEEEKELAKMIVETNNMQNNILVANDLVKMYGPSNAVDHLSFTVRKGECFGLLGINGAGKTTTFKMIGGSHLPTSGTILLDGYTFETNPYEYYRKLGYCPQDNTHTKRISVLDNLLFYARINGVPSRLIDRTVKTLIGECDLQDHKNKFAEKLSGGNKRKLSTAIALIGKKDLILLDEPTTGVDPVARRKLWKAIDFFRNQLDTSFILTSHSMDEVEQLCGRISIMAAGKFKALGTFSYLKDRYSQGFTITIKIKELNNKDDYVDRVKQQMDQTFNGKCTLKEFYMNTMIYIILSKAFNWSHLFRNMESLKSSLDFEDFMIMETNLEQIFLSFVDK